ncbi:MAG: response regulator [Spirochaetes bacterium]|nr:response regulator [Spirochaetota bacterium]
MVGNMSKSAILCVDDEAIIVMSLMQELKMNLGDRFVYESAMNAQEAFQAIEDLMLDGITVILVISDWLMPGIKGDEFLIKVREKYPSIRSIMITGQADDAAVERVMKEAMTSAVLRKPWNTRELIESIEQCCSNGECTCP